MRFQEAEDDAQHSLRVGDTVLLYAKETKGYVFSELSRYLQKKKKKKKKNKKKKKKKKKKNPS